MLPSVDHLYALAGDEAAFEAERNRIIRGYISSLPEDVRRTVYAMQCKIDVARETMTPAQFLEWMQQEARELGENLTDQLVRIRGLLEGPPSKSG